MQSQSLQHLLTQVKSLTDKYDKLAQLSGETFNIFKVLKLHTSEVKLHSNFLAELLNPQGSHGHKDVFLKLFFDLFHFKGNAFKTGNAMVDIEKHLGAMNEIKTEGGRVDILITDIHRNHMVIENKIYARDQAKQLTRYRNHYPTADLFYLTLDGRQCEEADKEGLQVDTDYKCLSYKHDITKWLEFCRKESVANPTLRETITQYLFLIKHLCNQAINDNMAKELNNLINLNLEAAFTIHNNLDAATNELMVRLSEEISMIAKEFQAKGYIVENGLNLNNKYSGLSIYKADWKYIGIYFQMQEYGRAGMVYGLCAFEDMTKTQIPEKLRMVLNPLVGIFDKSQWWVVQRDFEPPYKNNWETSYEPWQGIANGDLVNSIKAKINEMILLLGDINL